MPKRALVEHRPWLLFSITAAIAYYFLQDSAVGGLWLILLKGAAVAALAIYALRRSAHRDARLLVAVMMFSSLGDMGIELSFEIGGLFFFLAHLVAISLYLMNGREVSTFSQKALAVVLLLGTPAISYLLSGSWEVTLYALALGGMAATAWMSRFPRYRVGIGAVLFVISDWLIFAQLDQLNGNPISAWLIWPSYFLGQFLIATGVVQTLRGEHPKSGS